MDGFAGIVGDALPVAHPHGEQGERDEHQEGSQRKGRGAEEEAHEQGGDRRLEEGEQDAALEHPCAERTEDGGSRRVGSQSLTLTRARAKALLGGGRVVTRLWRRPCSGSSPTCSPTCVRGGRHADPGDRVGAERRGRREPQPRPNQRRDRDVGQVQLSDRGRRAGRAQGVLWRRQRQGRRGHHVRAVQPAGRQLQTGGDVQGKDPTAGAGLDQPGRAVARSRGGPACE
jgi:hypothetical protein